MGNLYYIIHQPPIIHKKLSYKLERAAKKLADSGKIRIDAIDKINFVKLPISGAQVMLTFSHREIKNKKLLDGRIEELKTILSVEYHDIKLQLKIDRYIEYLNAEMAKQQGVSEEEELKLARLIVQSSHPVCSLLLIKEEAEIFISYEHYVAEMLDMEGWKRHGSSSGMQAASINLSSIYISCGGNPLIDEKKTGYEGDGFNAICRFMVIAAQEIGHFADMIRDEAGNYVARHSADIHATEPTRKTRKARINDVLRMNKISAYLESIGLNELAELEKRVLFLSRHRKVSTIFFRTRILARVRLKLFIMKMKSNGMEAIASAASQSKYFGDLRGRKISAIKIKDFIKDMKNNLEPTAPAYKRDDADAEEAVACIEALARVPQQVVKWGHDAVKYAVPRLYAIYYKEVITDCIRAYKRRPMPVDNQTLPKRG